MPMPVLHISSKKVLQYICKKSVGAFQFDHQLREHVDLAKALSQ